MIELQPKTDVDEITGLIDDYLRQTSFALDNLGPDCATIALPNGEVDTVESDLDNVIGFSADRLTRDLRHNVVFALGLIIGSALNESGGELPEKYQEVASRIAQTGTLDG